VIRGLRKAHHNELHNLYCSPNKIETIEVKQAWSRRGMHRECCLECQKQIDHYEDLDKDGKIILNCIFQMLDRVIYSRFIYLIRRRTGGLFENNNKSSGSIKYCEDL
jgi:hypothetical protein